MDSEEFENSKNHLSSRTVIKPDGTLETRMTYNSFFNKNNSKNIKSTSKSNLFINN